jgi:uncharacterized protein YecE (DUF72 family)
MGGHACIGTSGWNYESWRRDFYRGLTRRQWLEFCSHQFTGMEVNATFYRLQSVDTFRRWRRDTLDDFRFTIKGNRFVTHNKKLADPLSAIRHERDRAKGLGKKLTAVVWQLPERFHKNMERIRGFVRALGHWRAVRHAIEFRHDSWFDEEVADCLRRHRIAVCQSDAADWPLWDAVTTDMVYVRLHGHDKTYVSSYSREELCRWASRTRKWLKWNFDVHVYFDNDARGAAPRNASELIRMVK